MNQSKPKRSKSKTATPGSPTLGSSSSNVFQSKEMRDLHTKIEKIRKKARKTENKIEEVCVKLIEKKFDKRVLDELEELEKAEIDLEAKHVCLCRDYMLAKQKTRRDVLIEHKQKLRSSVELPNPTSISKIEVRIFGTSTKKTLTSGELDHDLSTWELDAKEITFLSEKLGKGTFGSVVKGKLRGKTVAVKTIETNWKVDGEINIKIIDNFRTECAVMTKLLHPNVLLLMGVCIEPDQGKLIMVTELMPRGSVFDLLHRGEGDEPITFKQRMRFARDTALGLNWLHLSTPPILHLDLKTQNILVDENWVAKVADFGLSRIKKRDIKGAVGSPLYMAPEVLNEQPYDEKADVYSFGVVLSELVSGMIPYQDQSFETITDVYRFVVKQQRRPTLPLNCPARLVRLIQSCWDHDPKKRPSFKAILESQVLDEVILDAVISDANAEARTFWLQAFKTNEGTIMDAVPWKVFIKNFIKYCNINVPKNSKWFDLIELKALHLALVPNAENLKSGTVVLEEFGRALEWFGPFTPDERFIKSVCDTIHINGFFGDITSENAERQMAGKQVGTYMLRFSSQPGCYTVTVMEDDRQLKHYRIKHRAGKGYAIGKHEYASLPELVKARKTDLGLKRFLGGSKYAQLFVAHESQVDGTYVVISPSNTKE